MTTRIRICPLLAGVVVLTPAVAPAQQPPSPPAQQGAPANPAAARFRNPASLRAVQILGRQGRGTEARVRFEWDQVPGAREYVLRGQWMQPPSWTMQARKFHVTRRNAATWSKGRVQFDAVLPAGTHSWTVVAVFGSSNAADFDNPTTFSFDVR